MALPHLDSFVAADGTALDTYNPDYFYASGEMDINTNAVYPSVPGGGVEIGVLWGGDSFDNDQYSQVVIKAVSASELIGPGVRLAAPAVATYYGYYGGSVDSYLFKSVAGVWTQLGATGGPFAVNDVIRLEVEGTTLRPMKNGVVSDIGEQVDASIALGFGGLVGFGMFPTTRATDLDTGNLEEAESVDAMMPRFF